MTAFYCDRLEDETSTKENIAGLTALQEMSGFGEEEVNKVCNAYNSPLCLLTKVCSRTSICQNIFKRLVWRYSH